MEFLGLHRAESQGQSLQLDQRDPLHLGGPGEESEGARAKLVRIGYSRR